MSIKHKALPWLNPEVNKPQPDTEYLVIGDHNCYYVAFFEPLGFEGWLDILAEKPVNVKLYQELPNAKQLLKQLAKSAA